MKYLLLLTLFISAATYAQKQERNNLQAARFAFGWHHKKSQAMRPDTLRTTVTAKHMLNKSLLTFEGYIIRNGRRTLVYDTCWGLMPKYYRLQK